MCCSYVQWMKYLAYEDSTRYYFYKCRFKLYARFLYFAMCLWKIGRYKFHIFSHMHLVEVNKIWPIQYIPWVSNNLYISRERNIHFKYFGVYIYIYAQITSFFNTWKEWMTTNLYFNIVISNINKNNFHVTYRYSSACWHK